MSIGEVRLAAGALGGVEAEAGGLAGAAPGSPGAAEFQVRLEEARRGVERGVTWPAGRPWAGAAEVGGA